MEKVSKQICSLELRNINGVEYRVIDTEEFTFFLEIYLVVDLKLLGILIGASNLQNRSRPCIYNS